jgi:adenine-specific DNA-methyltransferase
MTKLKLHTPDFTEANIAKIAELFPQCLTETTDGNGDIKRAIDFDLLKQELSSSIVEGTQERYQLNWVGKKEALLTANAPIAKTLRPCRTESVDFDTTKNLYIEGDNLDALKLLQETYLNQVKMIYIDPPYNTGNDFIYEDDFAEDTESYKLRSNQTDEDGNRLIANTESNGRFHSDWLSMMYSRLKLARNLLKDDGVIFISIDDNEQANLKRLCDEVFGEDNFIECFIWIKKTAPNNVIVGSVHEYILIYAKSLINLQLYLQPRADEDNAKYTNPDNDPRGAWMADNITSPAKGGRSTPSLIYELENPFTGEIHTPPNGRMWSVTKPEMLRKISDGTVVWGKNNNGRPMNKRFLHETRDGKVMQTLITDGGSNSLASKEIQSLFNDSVVFETPKPTTLLSKLISLTTKEDGIVLDFFSGSSTTAHAVMQLNAEDGGNRNFIMVQLPETCDEKSEAYKAGFATIAEIGKERIRRAGQKIKTEKTPDLDIGFRVLKIDSSNMNEVYYSPDSTKQSDLLNWVDNIRHDRNDEDLLFQVLLDWGVDLTLPITQKTIDEKTVFTVANNEIVACFDRQGGITEDFIKELAKQKPLRVVFCDSGFADDSVKINIEQVFKSLSPQTEIKTI